MASSRAPRSRSSFRRSRPVSPAGRATPPLRAAAPPARLGAAKKTVPASSSEIRELVVPRVGRDPASPPLLVAQSVLIERNLSGGAQLGLVVPRERAPCCADPDRAPRR